MKFKLQLFVLLNLITLFCANNVANNGEFVDNTITKAAVVKEIAIILIQEMTLIALFDFIIRFQKN